MMPKLYTSASMWSNSSCLGEHLGRHQGTLLPVVLPLAPEGVLEPGEPEVGHLDVPLGVQQQVERLEVAVRRCPTSGGSACPWPPGNAIFTLSAIGHVRDELVVEEVVERAEGHVLHDDAEPGRLGAGGHEEHDVGVAQPGHDRHLVDEVLSVASLPTVVRRDAS